MKRVEAYMLKDGMRGGDVSTNKRANEAEREKGSRERGSKKEVKQGGCV